MARVPPPWSQRLPFYYGWIVVAGHFLATTAFAGPGIWAFGILAVAMGEDMGWSRSSLFGALTLRSFLAVLVVPVFSRLVDRERWPAPLLAASGVISGASLVAVSLVETQLQFYAVYGVLGGIGAVGTGQMYQVLVPKWFVRRRGITLSLGSMGSPAAAMLYPVVVQWAIGAMSWREAWVIVGVAGFLLTVPFALLIRRRPEDLGLLPDGDTVEQLEARRARARPGDRRSGVELSFTVRQAVRHRSTWLVVAATVLAGPTLIGLAASWVPYYRDQGVSEYGAALAITFYGIFAVASRIVWGMLGDRFHIRGLMITVSLITAASMVLLLQVDSTATAMVNSSVHAFALGGYAAIQPLVLANYFGREHLGAIRGAFQPPVQLTVAAGPLALAAAADATGSYTAAFIALLGTWLAVAVLFYWARPLEHPYPRRPGRRTGPSGG